MKTAIPMIPRPDSIPESKLRTEFSRLSEVVFRQAMELAQARVCVIASNESLTKLAELHVAGNGKAIQQYLDALAANLIPVKAGQTIN